MDESNSRRRFLETAGAGAALVIAGSAAAADPKKTPTTTTPTTPPATTTTGTLPTRALGKTGAQVSILGLGGYHLGTLPTEDDAKRLVHEAIDNGLTFMDSAWEYHDGKSELWLGSALQGRREKAFVMTKLCTHGRDKRTAMEQLHTSLRRMKVDHIDLWQIDEVAWPDDPKNHYKKDGAIEALAEAKKSGKVRFTGFTGHKDPALHKEMIAGGFAFDTVQMPLNPFDGTHKSFENEVLPDVVRRGMGALGMKSLSGDGQAIKAGVVTPEECIRYVLSLPIASLISGIDSRAVLLQNLDIARRFQPMTDDERKALRERLRAAAATGKYEAYKTTRQYEGPIGRAQHGVPPKGEG